MFKFITKLFDQHQKMLDEYRLVVDKINALEPKIKKLSDKKLAAQTAKFKKLFKKKSKKGETKKTSSMNFFLKLLLL